MHQFCKRLLCKQAKQRTEVEAKKRGRRSDVENEQKKNNRESKEEEPSGRILNEQRE